VILLVINSFLAAAIVDYAVLKKLLAGYLSSGSVMEEEQVQELRAKVLPAAGFQTSLLWGDIGKELVEAGAIDEAQYRELFRSPTEGLEDLDILEGGSVKPIAIHENNSHLVLNTLWAFGLTQKSKVLDEGPMQTSGTDLMNFASTAGWTLGTKEAAELYSSRNLVELNGFQQDLVMRIAESVYRPCCDNHTAFPDCNHGMAALGLIELEVAAGIPEDRIYQDLLAFNSFWFPQTYLELAAYFSQEGTEWEDVDPRTALSAEFSSATGSQTVGARVQDLPGLDSGGGGCGI